MVYLMTISLNQVQAIATSEVGVVNDHLADVPSWHDDDEDAIAQGFVDPDDDEPIDLYGGDAFYDYDA